MMSALDSPHSGVLWGSVHAYCDACCCCRAWHQQREQQYQHVEMSAHADAESSRSGQHAPPEERRPTMADCDVDATWHCHDPSTDVTFYGAAAAVDVDVAALDDDAVTATEIAIGDARWS